MRQTHRQKLGALKSLIEDHQDWKYISFITLKLYQKLFINWLINWINQLIYSLNLFHTTTTKLTLLFLESFDRRSSGLKKADREIKGRELRDHRGIIFASLYTIIKNKMGDIFLLEQNQCHITGVKKSYFCHSFH